MGGSLVLYREKYLYPWSLCVYEWVGFCMICSIYVYLYFDYHYCLLIFFFFFILLVVFNHLKIIILKMKSRFILQA